MFLSITLILIYRYYVVIVDGTAVEPNSSRYQLYNYLFNGGYSQSLLPREKTALPVEIVVSYDIFAIHEVNEKEQTVQITGFLSMVWNDSYLRWNASDFEGLPSLVLPANKVWIPKIIVIQSTIYDVFDEKSEVRVYNDGVVIFSPHSVVSLKCSFDLTYYPFDAHHCWFQFEVWTYTVEEVVMQPDTFSDDEISRTGISSLWLLQDLRAKAITTSYGANYSGSIFYMTLKRKPLLQVFNVILPIILLSFLNLMVFRLPVASGEKVSLCITILVAFSVWQLMLNDIMPSASNNVPIIVIYIASFMIMSSASLVITVHIIRLGLTSNDVPVPSWIISFLRCCAFIKRIRKIYSMEDAVQNLSWKTVSETVDAFCFVVLLIIVLVSTAVMLILLCK